MEYERRINPGQEEPPRDEEEQDCSIEGENNSQSDAESREVTDSEGRGLGTEDGDHGAYDNDEEIGQEERGSSTIAAEGAEGENVNSADDGEDYKNSSEDEYLDEGDSE